MTKSSSQNPPREKKITIRPNGPYRVSGNIPLVRKTQVVSEHGEPLSWEKNREIETGDKDYLLCRCGHSQTMPFCDGTHNHIDFNGNELAITDGSRGQTQVYPSSSDLVVKNEIKLCMGSGFCRTRFVDIADLVRDSHDTLQRSLAIAMVERCPSGALTYALNPNPEEIEPDYPQQIADSVEITSDGPIRGPLWVTGKIEIIRSDGQPFVARNRVTLCCCGQSQNKPLCDGSHRLIHQRELRDQKRKSDLRE